MPDEKTHNEIMHALGNLEGSIDKGFGAVNQRLDTINGKIINHDERLRRTEISLATINAKTAMIGGVVGFIVSIGAILLNYLRR